MLLSIKDLRVDFRLGERGDITRVPAVAGVSFDIPEDTTVALVGESGSGKSVTAMSILNLLPENAERTGVIEYQGRFVGQLTVSNIVRGSAQFASIGYWIDEAYAGRGIVTRAVAMAIDHCFGTV